MPAGQLAKFAVSYLASPATAAELREMSGGMGDGDEDAPEAEPTADESGS